MIFEWDLAKARSNVAKHGLAFELAQEVWDDPLHAIGLVGTVALLVVVHIYPAPNDEERVRIIGARRRPHRNGDDMKTKHRSAEAQAQLDRLAALPDDGIDTTDIPEAPAKNWVHARRPGLYRPLKKPVTLRLDADVIEWFKEHAATRGYQTEINHVLRRHVADAEARS